MRSVMRIIVGCICLIVFLHVTVKPLVCLADDNWTVRYTESLDYTEDGKLLPPRGLYAEEWGGRLYLKRFYTGTIDAFKGPEEVQLTLKVKVFSAVQAQDPLFRDESGYLFCMFFKAQPCPECEGKGRVWVEAGREECPGCNGTGKVRWHTGFMHDCMRCDGKGYIEHEGRWKECERCEGTGRVIGRTPNEQKKLHIHDRDQCCFQVTGAERITLDAPDEARFAVFVLRRHRVRLPPKRQETREKDEEERLKNLDHLYDEVLADAYRLHGKGPVYAELHLRRH